MINELAQAVHQNAKDKGFYDDGKAQNMGERLALIHSEVSEALEADREGRYCISDVENLNKTTVTDNLFTEHYKVEVKGTFEEEMADIVIRVMDVCAHKGINLEAHIKAKMRYNSTRQKMHGKKY